MVLSNNDHITERKYYLIRVGCSHFIFISLVRNANISLQSCMKYVLIYNDFW